jgi:hypothetical protein
MMHDYKHYGHRARTEPPLHVALSCVVFAALCAVVLTAPTWLAWIEGVCR